MKRFKEFLTEKNDEEDQKVNSAYLNLNSQLNPYNSNWTTDMYLANVLSPKPNMGLEKTYNTDVGIAFDQDADTGELYGSPEGFKAVNKRTKEDRNIKLPRSPTADELRVNLFNILSGG